MKASTTTQSFGSQMTLTEEIVARAIRGGEDFRRKGQMAVMREGQGRTASRKKWHLGQALKDRQNLKIRSGRKTISKLERREGSVGVRHGESPG